LCPQCPQKIKSIIRLVHVLPFGVWYPWNARLFLDLSMCFSDQERSSIAIGYPLGADIFRLSRETCVSDSKRNSGQGKGRRKVGGGITNHWRSPGTPRWCIMIAC
jgi:hypothetical protein